MREGEALATIRDLLLKERHALLDLSTRNRLLNVPLRAKNNRVIEIVDEKSVEVFRLLTEGKALSFVPGLELSEEERSQLDPDDDVTGGIPQPDDDSVDERGVAARHADKRLQTRLTSEGLQKRLLNIFYDAQTLEQEQGVNILYLAVGLLRWFDSDSSDKPRHAPLVLLPVKLERTTAAEKFKVKWREEPPSPNLTLQAKLNAEFALQIDDFSNEDELDLSAYFDRVAETVRAQRRWQVLPDAIVMGFFSFAKFLMYRDLDPANWPEENGIDKRELVASLLRDGFPSSPPLMPDDAAIDDVIRPINTFHVVDADSSQTVAIAEAVGGRSLVVKGPPGTGKSQTITNIIAAAVAEGKKVLFVAEKMAALGVVHRRLQQVGLGPLALELHSNKVSKRTVLEELRRTRDGQLRNARGDLAVIGKLGETSGFLNAFARRLHEPLMPSGLTPHAILGRLAQTQSIAAPAGFALEGAERWGRADVAERGELADEVAERQKALGPILESVWRGAQCDVLDPAERESLAQEIKKLADDLADARRSAAMAERGLGIPVQQDMKGLGEALAIMSVIPLPPTTDRAQLTHSAWKDIDGLRHLVDAGRDHLEADKEAREIFSSTGLDAEFDAIRIAIVTKGKSLFRFLDGNYRAQVALLRSYLKVPLPKTQAERIRIVDIAVDAQTAAAQLADLEHLGAAFGSAWRGPRSDWDELDEVLHWREACAGLPDSIWPIVAATDSLVEIEEAGATLGALLPELEKGLKKLFTDLDLHPFRAFGVKQVREIPLDALADRLTAWMADLEGLSRFSVFAARARDLSTRGASKLVEALHDGRLDHRTLRPAFDRAYGEVLRASLFAAWPDLRSFDGDAFNKVISKFRQLDRARINLAQEQIISAHAAARPHGGTALGPLGVLNGEIAKRRAHLPIRVLLQRAGPAIQQLKPILMMSPLSVAQFLRPESLHFDLLVMDEASQIEPVDAIGAIARANQIVVVGDEKQLPPTMFFRKLTGDEEWDEEDDNGVPIRAKDAESILDLALAKGLPHRMLNWHYRSKHQSLIAVSNHEFYENRLFIVPSPYDAIAGIGLKFRLLKDTVYDRGGTRTNVREAHAVAEAVVRHARTNPEQSLGVATFSVAQRQAVQDELEILRRSNPDIEEFFSQDVAEPFFVKNLENIQGDERDVIFISVGYGKNETGYLAHGFGPLSAEGGERRLNVLISRAKLRCEVFCNFTGADIDLDRTRARGVAALKLFLTFAETGHFGLGERTGEDFGSEFEAQVCERLQARGFDVQCQIGVSGFRVDLAISDPDRRGRFMLGIECDGAQYHSSRSARDRDRLRQQVLEAHGWIIHRIWGADWYMRPEAELKKIEDAIAAARAEWVSRDEGQGAPKPSEVTTEPVSKSEGDPGTAGGPQPAGQPADQPAGVRYREAEFAVNRNVDPHEAPLAQMANYVVQIIEVEGPIHIDEIVVRIRTLWGLSRAGARIRAAVERATKAAARRGAVEADDHFYHIPGGEVLVRDRSAVTSPTLRRPDMLPPAEIERAVLDTVDTNFGASLEELIQAVARAFGFASTSSQLRAAITYVIDGLLALGGLVEQGDLLRRPDNGTSNDGGVRAPKPNRQALH
jgi:very-short-patch-repair endonuclease